MKHLKQILSLLIRIIYFICLLGLLISYFSPYANPQRFWLFSFFGLAYPFILLINILFLIWWIVRWKKLYWLSLICILAGWTNMKNLFHIFFLPDKTVVISDTSSSAGAGRMEEVKVLSYNVRLFDLYNWTHNKNTRSKIFYLLKNESTDIVCLQEFFQSDSGYFETSDTLINITQSNSRHIEYTLSKKKKHHWGIATFSKYPIVNKGRIAFKMRSHNICIFSDLKIGNDTVRVYNMHLQSISFDYADYKFFEALKARNDTLNVEDIEIASKNILRRIKRAFLRRAIQTEKILEHVSTCKYPIILCGDFNDTPFSHTYHSFSEKLQDAFMESGMGMGSTYLGVFPAYRIDYIFHSKDFTSSDFQVLPEELSDHYPIRCSLMLKSFN